MVEGPRKKQHSSEPPCAHNEWDNIRFKNMIVTLRCRVCREQWKTLNVSLRKCAAFYEKKCSKGSECDMVHINRHKHTRELCVNSLSAIEGQDDASDSADSLGSGSTGWVRSSTAMIPPPQDYTSIWAATPELSGDQRWDDYDLKSANYKRALHENHIWCNAPIYDNPTAIA